MKQKLVLYSLLAAACFFCSASLFAQKKSSSSGKIIDQANGQPLPDATVTIKEANQTAAKIFDS